MLKADLGLKTNVRAHQWGGEHRQMQRKHKNKKQTKPPPTTKAISPNSSCGNPALNTEVIGPFTHRLKVTPEASQAQQGDRPACVVRPLWQGPEEEAWVRSTGSQCRVCGGTFSISPEPGATALSGRNKHWSVSMPRPSGWTNPTDSKQCQTCLQWTYPGHQCRFHHVWDCD